MDEDNVLVCAVGRAAVLQGVQRHTAHLHQLTLHTGGMKVGMYGTGT